MIYGNRWPERAICAILPPRQDAPRGRYYALRGTCAQDREQSLLLQEAEKHNPQKRWGRLPGPCLRDMLFYPAVFSGPADAGEVHVATANSGELRISRLLVVWMLTFLFGTFHAEAVSIETGHDAYFEVAATPVALFLCQKIIHSCSPLSLCFLFLVDGLDVPVCNILEINIVLHGFRIIY